MAEVFMREMFSEIPKLMHFFHFVIISIINPLISYDGNYVYRRAISEMQHVVEDKYSWAPLLSRILITIL